MEKTYTMQDVAAMTGLTTRTLRSYQQQGFLRGEKENGVWRFTDEALEGFFQNPAVLPAIRGFYETKEETGLESVVVNGAFTPGKKRARTGRRAMLSNSREKNFICWPCPPLTMLGETGEPCGLNLAALADKLGMERVEAPFCGTALVEFGGYNRTWKCRAPAVAMYDRGSLFQLVCSEAPPPELLHAPAHRRERRGHGTDLAELGRDRPAPGQLHRRSHAGAFGGFGCRYGGAAVRQPKAERAPDRVRRGVRRRRPVPDPVPAAYRPGHRDSGSGRKIRRGPPRR